MTSLDGFIGHGAILRSLTDDIASRNIAHAYLFSGPLRVGKMAVAKWFSQQILTQGMASEERAIQASLIDRLLHPDLLVLDRLWIEGESEDWYEIAKYSNVPQEHRSKGEHIMRTDSIGIDDVRVLQERFTKTASGTFRVCIIHSVERMHDEASNALLKILEEPPPHRVFILTTSAEDTLPPTIPSRCRLLRFFRVPEAAMRPLVAMLPPDEAGFLLHLAQGAPGVLKSLLLDPELLRAEQTGHAAALGFWTADRLSARIAALEPLHKRGSAADQFLMHLALTLREVDVRYRLAWGEAYLELQRGLSTNAHRFLIANRFAYAVDRATLSTS